MAFFIQGWISEAVLSNSFRSSRLKVLYQKVRKIFKNSQKIICVRVSFSIKLQFSRVIEIQKSKSKTQIRETLFCWDIHQLDFLTWIYVHHLSFLAPACFNYRLHDYFQLFYMKLKFHLVLFKPWWSFSSVYCDETFSYNRNFKAPS